MLRVCLQIGEGNRKKRMRYSGKVCCQKHSLAISQCDYASFTCLGHLEGDDTNRNDPNCQGKSCSHARSVFV